MNFMQQISGFVLNTKYGDIDPRAIEFAKIAILDYTAVTLAGSLEDSSQFIQEYAIDFQSKREAKIFGTNNKVYTPLAALCNGVASHANDYDDCSETEIGHPSITVLPALFALGESLNISGKKLIEAYLIAVEVQNKVSVLALPETSKNGWHTTCVFGHIGSAIASSILLSLNEKQISNAIAISCSQAGGLKGNFGTMTKPYHPGHASYNGMTAALLAKKGMTGATDIIESKQGFIKLFSGKEIYETDLKLGNPWDIVEPGFQIKLYPSCSASHPASEALFNILEKNKDLKINDIKKINAGIGLLGISELICHTPKTPDEARFSIEYALACPIVYGKITLDEFTPQAINNKEIKEVMKKVNIFVDDELALLGLTADEPCKLSIELNDGRVLEERCMLAKGQPKKRLSMEEMNSKFTNCAQKVYKEERCKKIFDSIMNIENIKFINEVVDLM